MQFLRSFVMVQDVHSAWTVFIFRDLEGLISSCKQHLIAGSGAVLVHVGFDRPSCESFGNLVEKFSGCLLLTGSARFALGTWGSKISDAIDHVAELPLHVVLEGFGYSTSLEELGVILATDVSMSSASSDASRLPIFVDEGATDSRNWSTFFKHELFQHLEPWRSTWVAELRDVDQDLSSKASKVGIINDETYLALERNLPREVRVQLGLHRFRVLIRNRRSDPTSVARCSPPWLLDMDVAALFLPTRPSNCLTAACITKVQDFCVYTESDILRMPNLGRKSFSDITKALLSFLEEEVVGSTDSPEVNAGPTTEIEISPSNFEAIDHFLRTVSSTRFVDLLQEIIGRLKGPQATILRRRMGYGGRAPTLQQIAETVGVTRERVRQIEAAATKNLKSHPVWPGLVRPKLESMLEGRTTPLPFIGLDVLDPWFKEVENMRLPFSYCLENFMDGKFSILEINEQYYVSKLSQVKWDESISTAEKILEASASEGWTESYAKAVISNLLIQDGEELRLQLWDNVSHRARFGATGGGERILLAYGNSAEDHITAVLADSDRPLHFSEISQRISTQIGRDVGDRYVHAACGRCALLYGRGSYGLRKHFPLTDEEADLVVFEAEDIIRAGRSGRQWACDEIRDKLAQRGLGFDERLDKHVLNIALKKSKILAYLGRLVWTMDSSGRLTTSHRIDVRQAIISILEAESGPLTFSEIRERLHHERGISDVFQVQPIGNLIRIGDNLWGLADRDIGLGPDQQREILDELFSILSLRNKGIHETELLDSLVKTRAYGDSIGNTVAIMALAQRDGRMRISIGQYLYLATWEGPRRLQVADAARETLLAFPKGLSVHVVVAKVSALMKRPIAKESIYGAFRNVGARWDEASGFWTLPQLVTDEDSDAEA